MRKAAVTLAITCAAGLTLTGCRGVATAPELQARGESERVGEILESHRHYPESLTSDSGLEQLLRFAMLNQPRVEAAYYDWAASVERITLARSLPDPRLTFESDIADIVMTVMPGLMQEFPGPGKLKAAARVARAESRVKYFAFESAVLQTALDLKRSFYNLHFLEEKIRINRKTFGLLGDLEKIARAQNQVGRASLQDVYRTQIEQDQLATEIANLEDSRRPLLAQLKGALGLTHDQPAPPVPACPESTALELNGDDLFATGIARNPRLKAMSAEVRMAEAGIAMATKTQVPDFSLGLMTDLKAAPVMFRPLAGMTLPIWRDKIAAQIAQAQAGKRAAEARLNSEQILLAVDYAMKSYDYREVTRNLALLQHQLIPKARQSLELARSGYLSGTIDFFNLIDAERTLLNFELADVEARTRREIILSELSLLIAGVPPAGAPVLNSNP